MASNQSKRRRHRRSFGAIRQLASGNYQASFKAFDGSNQVAPQTFKTREAADNYLAVKQSEQIAEKQAHEAGRFILSLWVAIIALTGIVMGAIFISDPAGFSPPNPTRECSIVEVNGEARDTCEDLYP